MDKEPQLTESEIEQLNMECEPTWAKLHRDMAESENPWLATNDTEE